LFLRFHLRSGNESTQEGTETMIKEVRTRKGGSRNPTPQQIREMCSQIRQGWSAREELERRVGRFNQRIRVGAIGIDRLDLRSAERPDGDS
jgi:hypothetical protein